MRYYHFPANICLFKVNNGNTRTRGERGLKLTIKTPEWAHWCQSGVFIVNFEHISQLFLVFLLLTLNKWRLAELSYSHLLLLCWLPTACKVSKYGFFSGPYYLVFSPNTGKYAPENTPYLNTFHAVSHVKDKYPHLVLFLRSVI